MSKSWELFYGKDWVATDDPPLKREAGVAKEGSLYLSIHPPLSGWSEGANHWSFMLRRWEAQSYAGAHLDKSPLWKFMLGDFEAKF